MIDFKRLANLTRTREVHLRGEWRTVEVAPEERDAAGNAVKAAVTRREFTGVTLTVRALFSAETTEVQNAFDRPAPPMIKDPTKGSNAPGIPNYDDADYVRLMREHGDLVVAARAAVAVGHEVDGKRFEDLKPGSKERKLWLAAAAEEFKRGFFDAELQGIVEASRGLAGLAQGVEEALKN